MRLKRPSSDGAQQNRFGYTLGGPIKKDKLLLFTSYQGTRQRNGIDTNCSSSVILPVLTDNRSAAGLAAAVGPPTAFQGVDFLGRPVTAETVGAQGLALFNLKLSNGQYVVPNPQLRVPYQGFSASSFNQIQSRGFAWYNALQASLRKRFSHGLQFLASTRSPATWPTSTGAPSQQRRPDCGGSEQSAGWLWP